MAEKVDDEQAKLDALLLQQEAEFHKTQKKAKKKREPEKRVCVDVVREVFAQMLAPDPVVPARLQESIPEQFLTSSESDNGRRQAQMRQNAASAALMKEAARVERLNNTARAAENRRRKLAT